MNSTDPRFADSDLAKFDAAFGPRANIVLVEDSFYFPMDDFFTSLHTTARLGSVVSMSFTIDSQMGDFPFESQIDPYFAAPGVTFLAASGDYGAPSDYPALSPNVVAVGGTSLHLGADGSYDHENRLE